MLSVLIKNLFAQLLPNPRRALRFLLHLALKRDSCLSSAGPSDLVAGAEFRHLFFYLFFFPLLL